MNMAYTANHPGEYLIRTGTLPPIILLNHGESASARRTASMKQTVVNRIDSRILLPNRLSFDAPSTLLVAISLARLPVMDTQRLM